MVSQFFLGSHVVDIFEEGRPDLSLSLWSFPLEKASCHVVSTPMDMPQDVKLEAEPSAPFEPSDATVANSLPATGWETLSQNHPAKLLPDFLPSETEWDNKCLLF